MANPNHHSVVFMLLFFSILTIPYCCFGGCAIEPDGDGHVTIPNAWTHIEEYAFQYCSSLSTITIPNSVTSIGESAFSACSSLSTITIPNSVTTIVGHALSSCLGFGLSLLEGNNLRGLIQCLPCANKTTVTIPNSVTSIGMYAFRLCVSLSTITIPNSVTNIGRYAFLHCRSLSTITIPDTVKTIESYALPSCLGYGLSLLEDNNPRGLIQCLACTNKTTITIPHNVTSIGDDTFRSCSTLTGITIPDSVSSVGDSVFRSCSSLSTITIPDSVTSIGKYAFRSCPKLFSIIISNRLKSIENDAFTYCTNLSTITIPDSVTSIGVHAFRSCSSLTTINLSNSLTMIGNSAFASCSSLSAITIPNNVTSIGQSAFEYCSSLSTITIPYSVTTIDPSAFFSCGCPNTQYVAGATLCDCSECTPSMPPTTFSPTLPPTLSPTKPPSLSVVIDSDTNNNADAVNASTATIIVICVCVSLGIISVLILVVVAVRRRSHKQTTLQHIERISHQLLAQAKDTFYNCYGPMFKDETSETIFEQHYQDIVIQNTDCFSQLREIARGNGGIVHKAKYRSTTTSKTDAVAIKSCNVIDIAANHRLLVEARLMLLMKHPTIIPLVGVHLFKTTRPWLVTSFMVNGDLKMHLRGLRQSQLNFNNNINDTKSTDKDAIEVATKLAGALAYLNRIGVIHGDIAARNVLCGSPATNVVLSDFGNAIPTRLATQGNLGDRYSAVGPSVPFRWMAPEALLESILSHETDVWVWSFGVLLWEMDSYGKTPYGMLGYDDVKHELLKCGRLPKPTTGFRGLYEMATQCWCSRASERVTAHDLHQQLTVILASLITEDKKAAFDDSSYLMVGTHDEDGTTDVTEM